MNEDPVVTEVRRIREERARRFGYDIHKIFADIMARGNAADSSHPIAEDAGQWVEGVAAREARTVREEPPGRE